MTEEKTDEKTLEQKLEELINTPLSKEEAEKEFADNDINRMQLVTIRQKWQTQITQLQLQISNLDEQLRALEMERAVIFRRTLNGVGGQTEEKAPETIKVDFPKKEG